MACDEIEVAARQVHNARGVYRLHPLDLLAAYLYLVSYQQGRISRIKPDEPRLIRLPFELIVTPKSMGAKWFHPFFWLGGQLHGLKEARSRLRLIHVREFLAASPFIRNHELFEPRITAAWYLVAELYAATIARIAPGEHMQLRLASFPPNLLDCVKAMLAHEVEPVGKPAAGIALAA